MMSEGLFGGWVKEKTSENIFFNHKEGVELIFEWITAQWA